MFSFYCAAFPLFCAWPFFPSISYMKHRFQIAVLNFLKGLTCFPIPLQRLVFFSTNTFLCEWPLTLADHVLVWRIMGNSPAVLFRFHVSRNNKNKHLLFISGVIFMPASHTHTHTVMVFILSQSYFNCWTHTHTLMKMSCSQKIILFNAN